MFVNYVENIKLKINLLVSTDKAVKPKNLMNQ